LITFSSVTVTVLPSARVRVRASPVCPAGFEVAAMCLVNVCDDVAAGLWPVKAMLG